MDGNRGRALFNKSNQILIRRWSRAADLALAYVRDGELGVLEALARFARSECGEPLQQPRRSPPCACEQPPR